MLSIRLAFRSSSSKKELQPKDNTCVVYTQNSENRAVRYSCKTNKSQWYTFEPAISPATIATMDHSCNAGKPDKSFNSQMRSKYQISKWNS